MDSERERIQADLRGLLAGEVHCDDLFVQMYASDASLYEIRPLGIVRPRHAADVVACVKYDADQRIPLHARGAGTGLAGESLGPGLVLDFSHSMRRVVGVDGDLVRVQPGVVHAQLNRHLAPYGRLFGPDPALSAVTTMGSVLALDGSGSRWLRYGSARGRVVSLQVVLADGTLLEAGPTSIAGLPSLELTPDGSSRNLAGERAAELARQLAHLIERESSVIAAHQPQSLVNRSGYHLQGLIQGNTLDLAKLIVGSEGTLALITEATLRTDPLPKASGVVLLFFDRLDSAARGALEAARLGVSACDLMDRRLLGIARETDPRFAQLIPAAAEAMLLIEHVGDDAREVRRRLREVVERLQGKTRLAFDARLALDADEIELFWRLTTQVVSRLYSLRGADRPLPFIEDLAVPPEALPEFIVRLQNVLKAHQTTATLFGHAGHGQLHIRPFLDLSRPEDVRRMPSLAADLYREVFDVGGTISGEHGDGLSRTGFVRQQYGPLYEVFREVKRLFDPLHIFNPGKVIAETPQPLTHHLRPQLAETTNSPAPFAASHTSTAASYATAGNGELPDAGSAAGESRSASNFASTLANGPAVVRPMLELQLVWGDREFQQTASLCNGCGHCRTQDPEARMCPIFRGAPSEEASPRAKANLLRAVLGGRLSPGDLTSDSLKEVADLCVNCHQCRLECPANVDIPKLMIEAKAQYVATNGLASSDWFLTRIDRVAALASQISSIANWALSNRQARWILEKLVGLAQGRKLPRVESKSFLRIAKRRQLTRPSRRTGRKVVYFVDTYANWFDTQLADALVAVLEHNGVAVYVHPDQLPSGLPMISAGDLVGARRVAKENVAILAEAVRQGYHVVTSEPSAALCLSYEYQRILDDDDTRLVAGNTSDACAYLWQMHQSGQLELDLRPLSYVCGYHLPCHQRAMNKESPGEKLLRLIPGLSVRRIERGCSGMAGLHGLKRENYRASLRAGWGLITSLRDPALQFGATECATCKLQMEQGTFKPTLHPLKLLALAYNLMPQIASLLGKHGEGLVVT